MEKNENILTKGKNWVKNHKGIVIGAGCITLAGVGAYLGIKAMDTAETCGVTAGDILSGPSKKFVPELAKFGVDGIDEYSGAYEFMTGFSGPDGAGYPTKVGDIPEIVEIFKETTGVTDENDVYLMMNVGK
jgi:hypothetical protein